MKSMEAKVRQLKKDIDPKTTGCWVRSWVRSGGDRVEVDYFAVSDLIEWFEETKESTNRVLIARDMLEDIYFLSKPKDKKKIVARSAPSQPATQDGPAAEDE